MQINVVRSCLVFAVLAAIASAVDLSNVVLAQLPAAANNAPTDESLRRELLDMKERDQVARRELMQMLPGEKDAGADVLAKMMDIDKRHTARMKELVSEHGWPDQRLVGDDGAQAAWLLVQHADLDVDFQERCLALLEAAVKAGEAKPSHWAYLVDRVRVNRKRPQIYGTQFIDRGKGLMPQPIEDEEHIDERRKAVGLGTLAEYAETLRAASKPPKETPSR
jgi:hypothetical protein